MYRLFYVSTASPGVDDKTLDEIIKLSKKNNEARNVSGALSYNGFNFAQILEGEKEDVQALFEIIRKDERHAGVIVISEKTIAERAYKNWGMERVASYEFDDLIKSMSF